MSLPSGDRPLTTFLVIIQRQSPRDFLASQRRSLTPEDLPPLLARAYPHHSHEHSPPPAAVQPLVQEGRGSGPRVRINGANSHVAFVRRALDPRHSHHHHHHHNHHDNHHHHDSEHTDDVVVVEGDNDNVHIGRRSSLPDPHHHRHDQPHDRRSSENDIGRRSPDPRHGGHRHHHDHHDHHGNGHHKGHGDGAVDKVIIKGDDNNVSVHSRSRISRYQHSPERAETTAHEGHQHHLHARKYVPRHQFNRGGSSVDYAGRSKSAHRDGQDREEKQARSVLINSVEGEKKYLVPDNYLGQRITVIEGDDISKVLTEVKRSDPGIEGVPGSVEIMVRFPTLSPAHHTQCSHYLAPLQSQSAQSEDGRRIASLYLVHPDSTMAEFGNNTFILNASEGNYTQLYLVALNTTDSGVQGEDVPVALKVPVFNPDSASMEEYCATYDPQPPAPAPLSAEPCFYDESTGPHKSQVFAYTPSTSVIRPMWFDGEGSEDSFGDPTSNSTTQPDATVDPGTPLSNDVTNVTSVGDFGNSTAPPSRIAAFDNSTGIGEGSGSRSGSGNDSTIPAAEDFAAKAQNVTLIFTPAAPIIPSGSRKPVEDLPDLDETPLSNNNSTDTDTSASPLTSDTSGHFNNTETNRTGYSNNTGTSLDDFPAASVPLPNSVPSSTVSPAAVPSELGTSDEDKDLNVVVVGVARGETSGGIGEQDSSMRPVNTAPYKWKFDREHS